VICQDCATDSACLDQNYANAPAIEAVRGKGTSRLKSTILSDGRLSIITAVCRIYHIEKSDGVIEKPHRGPQLDNVLSDLRYLSRMSWQHAGAFTAKEGTTAKTDRGATVPSWLRFSGR
jgi:hypothetical protein